MSETNQALPEIAYSRDSVLQSLAKEKFVEGDYILMLTQLGVQISKPKPNKPNSGNSIMFNCQYRALRDDDDASSAFGPTIYHYEMMPWDNPSVKGHKAPGQAGWRSHVWIAGHITVDSKLLVHPEPMMTSAGFTYAGKAITPEALPLYKLNSRDAADKRLLEIYAAVRAGARTGMERALTYVTLGYDTRGSFDGPQLSGFTRDRDSKNFVDPELAVQRVLPVDPEAATPKANGTAKKGKK